MLEVTRSEFAAAHLVVIVDAEGNYRWSSADKRPPRAVARMLRGIADEIDPAPAGVLWQCPRCGKQATVVGNLPDVRCTCGTVSPNPTPAVAPSRTIPARTTDPETSHAATPTNLKAGTQRRRLLEAFDQPAAADGLTDEEAADLADGVPYRSEFAKRCSELRAAGYIEDTGATRAGVAGHQRIVSRITSKGRAALAIERSKS